MGFEINGARAKTATEPTIRLIKHTGQIQEAEHVRSFNKKCLTQNNQIGSAGTFMKAILR